MRCANCGHAAGGELCTRCRRAIALVVEAVAGHIVADILEGMAAEAAAAAPPIIELNDREACWRQTMALVRSAERPRLAGGMPSHGR